MTKSYKDLLIQARDAISKGKNKYEAIAALQEAIDTPDPEPVVTIEIPSLGSNTIIFRYFSDEVRDLPCGVYNLYLHPQQ